MTHLQYVNDVLSDIKVFIVCSKTTGIITAADKMAWNLLQS